MISKLKASAILIIVGLSAFWLGTQTNNEPPCDCSSRFTDQIVGRVLG